MAQSETSQFAGPGPEQVFEDALENGEFKIQKCHACGDHVFYPRLTCNHCGSADLEWVVASGRGTVHATSVVRNRPEDGPDYNISLVDLEEGPRMITRVVETPPDEVRIGDAVTAFIGDVDGRRAVLFRPA